MEDDNFDRTETLFLALCRPSLFFGVPFEAVMLNAFGCFFAGIIFQSPAHFWRSPIVLWLLCVPIHLVLKTLTGFDYLIFHVIRLRIMRLPFGSFLANYPEHMPETSDDIAVL